MNQTFGLVSAETGELYNMDNHGLIAKIRNPYDDKNTVIVVAGVRSISTKICSVRADKFHKPNFKKLY